MTSSPTLTQGSSERPQPPAMATWIRRGLPTLAAILIVSTVLALLPGRTAIPPNVQADYVYMLIAADRLCEGLGCESLQPVAPLQPWEWQYDWGWLTQWPVGYPVIVAATRLIAGLPTIDACRWISLLACAAALVGWFVWIKKNVPPGFTGLLVATAGAGHAVPIFFLLEPSTDALLVAALPYVLLLASTVIERCDKQTQHDASLEDASHRGWHGQTRLPVDETSKHTGKQQLARATRLPPSASHRSATRSGMSPLLGSVTAGLILSGLAAGGLFWIRYASVFVPIAIGLCMLLLWGVRRAVTLRQVALFAASTAVPVVLLVVLNRVLAAGGSMQQQLNLGSDVGFHLSLDHLGRAWWNFTDLGYYDYHWYSHWAFALWPVLLVTVAVVTRPGRRSIMKMFRCPGISLSALTLLCLLGMLVFTTTLFGGKFDYVGLERYYFPVRPIYFLLFVGPLLWLPARPVKVLIAAGLLIMCSWTVRQDWSRPYKRWLAADREVTDYGQWAICFSPGAAELYRWLEGQSESRLIVCSNFHDYIALETGIAAMPIPADEATLDRWVSRICKVRGITNPRILFVLDPDNRCRDYFLPDPELVRERFALDKRVVVPSGVTAQVFEYSQRGRSVRLSSLEGCHNHD